MNLISSLLRFQEVSTLHLRPSMSRAYKNLLLYEDRKSTILVASKPEDLIFSFDVKI